MGGSQHVAYTVYNLLKVLVHVSDVGMTFKSCVPGMFRGTFFVPCVALCPGHLSNNTYLLILYLLPTYYLFISTSVAYSKPFSRTRIIALQMSAFLENLKFTVVGK